jgi:N-acetylglucosaminyl-diphospho-decaprenol L-rhamnosyltransferase
MRDRPERRDPLQSATVVVVDWDLPDVTTRCVEDLLREGVPAARIVLVENGSTEDNVTRLRRTFPNLPLVHLEQNRGYARAANAGAAELRGDAYLFVNNDAFVHRPGSVSRLLDNLGRDRVGVAVPRLLNEDLTLQTNVVPRTRLLTAVIAASGITRLLPNRWQPRFGYYWDHAYSREIDCATGTVVAVDGDLWHELGGWAERELMFAEDIDLCWRAARRGWRIWFEADAEFVHLGNTSVGRHWSDRRRAERLGLAEAALIRAELPPLTAKLTLFVKCVGVFARIGFFSLRRNREAAASFRAMLNGYRARVSRG